MIVSISKSGGTSETLANTEILLDVLYERQNMVTMTKESSVISIEKNNFLLKDRLFPKLAPMITGKTTAEIMSAILSGTMKAYNDQALPFMEITLEGITAYELGAFMQFKMVEMMYLGRLFSVDTFNQPAVELYKVETKLILEGK